MKQSKYRIENGLFYCCSCNFKGPGGVVGIATVYGLDGLGIESR